MALHFKPNEAVTDRSQYALQRILFSHHQVETQRDMGRWRNFILQEI
jgi:hypothetical protein